MIPSASPITRRTMLARSARAATFVVAASHCAPLLAAPQSRRFKIGVIEGIIEKWCDPTSLDFAKEVGLDGIQVEMGPKEDPMRLCRPDVQESYRKAVQRTGLEIASVVPSVLCFVPLKRDPLAVEYLSKTIDVCKTLGLRIAMPPCFGPGNLDMTNRTELDYLVQSLKQVAPKAEKEGVVMGLESYMSAEENMRIIDRVGSSALEVYYDVGNSTDKGRDILKEIRTLGKHQLICEFHFKDGDAMLGQGRINFKQVRKALDDIEYSGWIQLETPSPHGLIPDFTANCKYLKEIFPPMG